MKKKLSLLLVNIFLIGCNLQPKLNFYQLVNKYIGKKYEISSLLLWRKTSDSFFLVTEEENYSAIIDKFSSFSFQKFKSTNKDSMIYPHINMYSLIFEYSHLDDSKTLYVRFAENSISIDFYDHADYFFYTNSNEDYFQSTKDYYLEIFHR